jgi:hypothetical protein
MSPQTATPLSASQKRALQPDFVATFSLTAPQSQTPLPLGLPVLGLCRVG